MNGSTNNFISFTKNIFLGVKELKNISLSKLRKVFSLMGKNEKTALKILITVAILSFVVSARNFYYRHTVLAPTFGGVYTEGLLGQPSYINPLLSFQEPDLSLTKILYAGLYKYGENGEIIPELAEGMPQISEDQKQYTVTLKKNSKWHNDKPITADDVIFTIQTLKDPAFKSPLRAIWQTSSVEKLSDYTVKFTTKDISGPFIHNLTLPILPLSIWGKVDSQNFVLSKNNLEAIGSGPYSVKEIKKLPSGKIEQITLLAFPNYFLGKAKIEQITFKFYDTEEDILNAFHSREVEGFGYVPLGSSLFVDKNQNSSQILTIPLPQYQVAFFNLNNKILADPTIRQALTLATDKDEIIEQVFKGNALNPESTELFNTQKSTGIQNPNLEQANNLLDNLGWKADEATGIRKSKKGTTFEITIATNDTLVNSKAGEILANQWEKLKIKVNLTVLPSKQLTNDLIKPRAFDVLLFPQKFGADPDPFLFWHSSQVKDPGFNLTGFSDTAVDKIISEARNTTDLKIRESKYDEFNKLVASKYAIIYLDQTEFIYSTDKNVKNVNLKTLYDPSFRFSNVHNWYINEGRVWK